MKSRIHRRVYLDYVGVKILNARGELEGELRVIGLFTSSAYNNAARTVPYLRHKVARWWSARASTPPAIPARPC